MRLERGLKIMKKNKKITLGLLLLLGVGLVAGAWVLGYNSTLSGFIISSEGVEWSSDFSITSNDTTNNSISKIETLSVSNPDGAFDLQAEIIINNTDDETDSCNNTDDVSVNVTFDGAEITDGEIVTIDGGDSDFLIETKALRRSCPQAINTQLILTEA